MGTNSRASHASYVVAPSAGDGGGGAGGAGAAGAEAGVDQFTGVPRERRCSVCGQFMSEQEIHVCPVAIAAVRNYRSEYGAIATPNITALRQNLDFDGPNPLLIPVRGHTALPDDLRRAVRGSVAVPRPGQEFDPEAAGAQLTCTCGQPNCRHVQVVAADLVDRIQSRRIRTPGRRHVNAVMGDVLETLEAQHAESVAAQERTRARWEEDQGSSYVDNPAEFQTAYRAAVERAANGEEVVPYHLSNATDGLGARDGGRAFGVELEFDLPAGVNREQALRAIAADMHEAGVSRRSTPDHRYHASAREGYSEDRDAWRLEHDVTVAGEVVSPILYDTPETWRDLATVCDIVRRHGGVASVNAGGHVHVSAHNYDHTVENHNRLMNLVGGYSDTLFRLASNPTRGRHRGVMWCAPNHVPAQGYRNIADARMYNASHNLALNMQSMSGNSNDHVEFRMWDASLEPGVIQSQINLSLGLTEAAFRTAGDRSLPNPDGDRLGNHRATYGRRRQQGEQWRSATRSFRSLVDTIFRRSQDREQAASLFAITRWQS